LLFFAEEGEGDFFFDEDEVLGGMDAEARAAYLARQSADMELEEGAGELGDVSVGVIRIFCAILFARSYSDLIQVGFKHCSRCCSCHALP
jgi:hypothetical protein